MSRIRNLFFIAIFSFFIFISSYTPIHAEEVLTGMFSNFPKNNPWSLAKEFCDKRSGELMNLETWYSGKCDKDVYTLSGDGVGFVDIIILQGMEWIFRVQYKSLPEQMIENIQMLYELGTQETVEGYQNQFEKVQLAEINQSIVPQLAQTTQKLINSKPATTTEYLAYISNNLKNKKIIPNAYAASAGYGFTALSPILPLWKAFRNIAYLLFALAFVVYGIMIMFRIRIDSKTAATIQLAIPKLVGTLILITFSYAIVGLLVDLSTVATALAIDVLRVGEILNTPSHPIIQTVGGLKIGVFGSFAVNFISSLIVTPFVIFNLILGGLSGMVAASVSLLGYLTGLGFALVIIIFLAIAWSYFKLVLKLFQSYISVIISLVFSPIILLGNVMPGSKAFSDWIMSIVGNLAVFPAASFLLVLSYALMAQPLLSIIPKLNEMAPGLIPSGLNSNVESFLGVNNLSSLNTIWTPPMTIPTQNSVANVGAGGIEGWGASSGSMMLATLGIGLLLMSSKYVDMVQEAMNVKPFKYGAAIGDALKSGMSSTDKFLQTRPGAVQDGFTTIKKTTKALGGP